MITNMKDAMEVNPMDEVGDLIVREIEVKIDSNESSSSFPNSASAASKPKNRKDTNRSEINPADLYKGRLSVKVEMNPLSAAGVQLSKILLAILTCFILIISIFVCLQETSGKKKLDFGQLIASIGNTPAKDSVFSHQLQLIKLYQEQESNSKEYIFRISQLILINVLLPILTAILGYIFGTGETSKLVRQSES